MGDIEDEYDKSGPQIDKIDEHLFIDFLEHTHSIYLKIMLV